MNGSQGKKFLIDYTKKARPILLKLLDQQIKENKSVGKVPQELLKSFKKISSHGKGVRGALAVLGYRSGGGKQVEEMVKTSIFLELVHASLLVHDDIMDRDDLRRGEETVHKTFERYGEKIGVSIPPNHYGESLAICLGDYIFYLGNKVLLDSKLPKKNVLEAFKLYSKYLMRVGMGQTLDMTVSSIKNPTEEDLLKVLWLKSGEYTCLLPLSVGAALAGVTDKKVYKAMEGYARCFGWAFQIQDDILGIYSDEKTLGKVIGSDIKEGKVTLLVMHLRKNGTKAQKNLLNNYLGKKINKKDLEVIRKLFKEAGSYDYVKDLGWKYVKGGKKYISKITKDNKLQDIYESLLYFVMERLN